MKSYCDTAKSLITEFKHVRIKFVKTELNSRADALAKGATYGKYSKKTELIMKEDLTEGKGEGRPYEVNMIDTKEESNEGYDWMKEIIDFLQESIISRDKTKA